MTAETETDPMVDHHGEFVFETVPELTECIERLRTENERLRSLLWSFVASAVLTTHLDTTVLGVNTNTWHEAADAIGYDEMGQ